MKSRNSKYVKPNKRYWDPRSMSNTQEKRDYLFFKRKTTRQIVVSRWWGVRKKSCGVFHHQGILNKFLNVNIYQLSCRLSNCRNIKLSLYLNILYLVMELHQPSYFNFFNNLRRNFFCLNLKLLFADNSMLWYHFHCKLAKQTYSFAN